MRQQPRGGKWENVVAFSGMEIFCKSIKVSINLNKLFRESEGTADI